MPLPFYSRGKAPGTHWIGGWVGPRAGLHNVEKRKFLSLLGLELWPLGHPARSQSLYRLLYPGTIKRSVLTTITFVKQWLSRRWLWRLQSSGTLRFVLWCIFTDVPEKHAASFFRAVVGFPYICISDESARMYQTAGFHIPEYTFFFTNLHIATHTDVFLN
jgi:hypothetical protein